MKWAQEHRSDDITFLHVLVFENSMCFASPWCGGKEARRQDEDVSKNLMVWAETAAVRARPGSQQDDKL